VPSDASRPGDGVVSAALRRDGNARDRPRSVPVGMRKGASDGLPSLQDLIVGKPFHGGDMATDARLFSARVRLSLPAARGRAAELRAALRAVAAAPVRASFEAAAAAFGADAATTAPGLPNCMAVAARFDFYAAVSGSKRAAWRVADRAVALLHDDATTDEDAPLLAEAVVGWLLYASDITGRSATGAAPKTGKERPRDVAAGLGFRMMSRVLRSRERLHGSAQEARVRTKTNVGSVDASFAELHRRCADVTWPVEARRASERTGVVVMPEIGNQAGSQGRRVLDEFGDIVRRRLPLVRVPDTTALWATLDREFPHADNVVSAMLDELEGRPHVRLSPFILVGSPGCGKTTLAKRLLELLGLPTTVFSCGGASDGALAGTSRRWASGEASLPLSMVVRHRTASPAIVLDELEKVGTSRHNGNVQDALLGLLERATASAWFDPYVQAPVDLSNVVWIGTANDVQGVPAPLRDRCRILVLADPRPRNLEALAPNILARVVAERGLDPRWTVPLQEYEFGALASAWRGGSLRKLRRLVEGVLACRDENRILH